MSDGTYTWAYVIVAVIAANLPWLTERRFFLLPTKTAKSAAFRLLEWLVMYFVTGAIGLGLEHQMTGQIYHKSWVFFTVTVSLFIVFALPGFVYRYDLRKHLRAGR
ncbi:hypothetical protein BJI67_09755 [Acidihalobacter aeolianus]|uniref:DUF2818 domain-containing protein n=1 Tax=Acidihalobacter aeolianus TaxID=2792603 RepID=A0A1D8K8R4_9GAMM|nr:DUF2818 family protein [Acidihalobacter aeolianus]AOV17311.1 hypothetical protein BJI67_09755 [Acidihalobacter aeolianus]